MWELSVGAGPGQPPRTQDIMIPYLFIYLFIHLFIYYVICYALIYWYSYVGIQVLTYSRIYLCMYVFTC